MQPSVSSLRVLGADGGGTKTLGILADGEGRLLARRQVGPGNPNVVGPETAARNLVDLLTGCCKDAACSIGDLSAVVLGLAGVGAPAIRDSLLDALRGELARRDSRLPPVVIESDARIALEGAFGGRPGAILIAGTGSIVLGKLPEGTIVRAGGWGRTLGDEGSGYFLGREALRAVAQEIDSSGSAGALRKLLAERHGWTSREQIIVAVYQHRFDLPSLAPLVLQAAESGDEVSRSILSRGAKDLAAQVAAVVRQIRTEGSVDVAFVGGLIDHDNIYTDILKQAIRRAAPSVRVRAAELPPAQGAVLLALHHARSSG